VVILGSASFVPFMQLKTSQRREVIEDILDIRIFSVMNQLLKDRVSSTKDSILKLDADIKVAKSKVESQNAIIKTIASAKTDTISALQEKIKANEQSIIESQQKVDDILAEIQILSEQVKERPVIEKDIKRINSLLSSHVTSQRHHQKHIHFFNDNNVCSTCSQEITEEYKDKVIDELQSKVYEEQDTIENLEKSVDQLSKSMERMNLLLDTMTGFNINLSVANNAIQILNKQNTELYGEIESVKNDTTNIDEEKRILKELASNAVEKIERKNVLMEERSIQEVSTALLKDTGIKTAIIREYLPVMNQLINQYLAIMDTYIKFELDESFNETIKSRYRDDFTYASFSEGEKRKIDVAILFTWRQIARMKNSVNTNLLILDEIFDGSLDSSATDMLLQLLNEVSRDSNIFVISHKGDILNDKFHSILKIEKRNEFSVIV
jgi:DNA repair exonuclease SbcCD ATPase subunit